MSDAKPQPDPNVSLVWSTDPKKKIDGLLNGRCKGDVNEALKKLFGGSTSYESAKTLGHHYAEGLGLTLGQFMYKYYKWRRNEL